MATPKKYHRMQARAVSLLHSLDYLRLDQSTYDFEIRIESETIPVHSVVLMATSTYFRELMKDNRRGFVVINGLNPNAFRACLNYIYSGKIELDASNINDIMAVCDIIQFQELQKLCVDYLSCSLCIENCLDVVLLLKQHGDLLVLADAVDQFVVANYADIIKLEDYRRLEYDDALSIFSKSLDKPTAVLWEGITEWIEHDQVSRVRLTAEFLIKMKKFDENIIFDSIIPHPLLQADENSKRIVTEYFLSRVYSYRNFITVANCFILNDFIDCFPFHASHKDFKNALIAFMTDNFESFCRRSGFKNMKENDLVMLLRKARTRRVDEKLRWFAIINWLHSGSDLERRPLFDRLFKMLDLTLLPRSFVRNEIISHELVRSSDECKGILLDVLSTTPASNEPIPSGNALLFFNISCQLKFVQHGELSAPPITVTDARLRGGKLIFVDGTCYIATKLKPYIEVFTLQPDRSVVVHSKCRSVYTDWDSCRAIAFRKNIVIFSSRQIMLIFNVERKEWRRQDPSVRLNAFCKGLTLCSSQDRIFSLALGKENTENLCYDPVQSSFSELQRFRRSRVDGTHCSSAAGSNFVWIVGGKVKNAWLQDDAPMEMYNIRTNSWTEINKPQTKKKVLSCIADEDTMYVLTRNSDNTFIFHCCEWGFWDKRKCTKCFGPDETPQLALLKS